MGWTNREIAQRLDCTERKVERKLHLIRLAWEAQWPA
jgi:DNA-directed RNA polymerase specialized sigma24 family protein